MASPSYSLRHPFITQEKATRLIYWEKWFCGTRLILPAAEFHLEDRCLPT